VLLLLVFVGRETIFSWTRPGAFAHETIAGRAQYLQPGGMLARTIICIAIWAVFAVMFRRTSLAQDRTPRANLQTHGRLNQLSAAFVVLFAFSFTAIAYDWIISVDPEWFSTMFSVNAFAGTFVQGIAIVTLAVIFLSERGLFGNTVGHNQFHDLGKMLLAFTTFWAYTWLCQFLLIWYSDIPEEVTHYTSRTSGPWVIAFAINFLMNWVIPFATLLSFKTKKSTKVLKVMCTLLLFGHWLDIYMQVMPAIRPGPTIGIFELGTVTGYVAAAYLVFVQALSRAPIVPVHDPVLIAEAQAPSHAHA